MKCFSLRFAALPALAALVLGTGACGRSDLFSDRRSSGNAGDISIAGDGGSGGAGGSVTGRGGGPSGVGGSVVAGRGGTGGTAAGRGGTGGTAAGRGGTGGTAAGRGGTGGTAAGRGGTGGTVAGRGGTGGTVAGRGGAGGSMGGRGGDPNPCTSRPEICNNRVDDNCNNFADCTDPGCFGDPSCAPPGQEICNNNLDDDDDTRIDCADPDCMNSISCRPTPGMEICDNRVDDNANNLVDCADPQCTTFPGCLAAACTADIDFGTIAQHGANVSRAINTSGGATGYATCAPAGGVARVGRFQLDAISDVRMDFKQGSTSAHVVGLFRAGAGQRCDRNPVDCLNVMDQPMAGKTFPALPPGVYWIIVASYPGLPGPTTVTLSTGTAATPEICANGLDDDKNGLTDCQDGACANHTSCAGSLCTPDINLGTLVVDAPARIVNENLANKTDDYQSTCSAGRPGGDIAIAFTLAETAGLQVQFTQTGRSIFSLHRMPAPGLACDAEQRTCAFQDETSNAVAFTSLAPGRWVFIVKAQEGRAGTINLRLSAFGLRGIEICGNNIDDDTNGLVDCDDPACFGLVTCPAPACRPDQDLGLFSWGTRRTVVVDTRDGTSLYPTRCSTGTGKEKVLRINLTQPMSLGHDCTDTGSHVIALARQVQPLDACNENQVVCVDPSVIPFGCGYSLPELQPGPYNVIVQSFQAGGEGIVTLTLTGIQEIVREICDNGVDDDRDGATDCMDRKCVTEPACTKFSCRYDQNAGILPLGGAPVTQSVVTTMLKDDQMMTACAAASGGQDGVIDFQVPAPSDVTLTWAQTGNHVFALYDNKNMLFACEAGTTYGCVASMGTPVGMHVFRALPAGRYHLIVDASQPGTEGGVVVQLSAVAATP
jgi:hypothetical protein